MPLFKGSSAYPENVSPNRKKGLNSKENSAFTLCLPLYEDERVGKWNLNLLRMKVINFYCYEDDRKTGIMLRMIRKG